MRVVFLGPPGSGKGTQAKLLAERLEVPAISTGDILRAAVRDRTPLGLQAQAVMEKGELVSDDLIVALIRERTAARDARDGFILDGFPRTLEQGRALEKHAGRKGESALGGRQLRRARRPSSSSACRAARAPRAARTTGPRRSVERLRVYREKTEPLVGFYRERALLADVDGVGTVERGRRRASTRR